MIRTILIFKIFILYIAITFSAGCDSVNEDKYQNKESKKENIKLKNKKRNLDKNIYEINRLSGINEEQKTKIKKLTKFIKDNEENFRAIGLRELFSTEVEKKVKIKLYYFNHNVANKLNNPCSSESISYIEKWIPLTENIIENTIRFRLLYQLSKKEIDKGFSGDFPITFLITNIELAASDSVLTLDFLDLEWFSSGGSCRVSILKSQLRKTALQFPQVNSVIFPKALFQP